MILTGQVDILLTSFCLSQMSWVLAAKFSEAESHSRALTMSDPAPILKAAVAIYPLQCSVEAGLRVLGDFQGHGSWYSGVICEVVMDDGVYSITYDDGDFEMCIPAERIHLLSSLNGRYKFYYCCSVDDSHLF